LAFEESPAEVCKFEFLGFKEKIQFLETAKTIRLDDDDDSSDLSFSAHFLMIFECRHGNR